MKKHMILLTAILAAGMLSTLPMQASAEDTAEEFQYLTAAKQITVTEEGIAYCMDGEKKRTGRFSLSPNFSMGDLNHDELVNSVDAVRILNAAAQSGASGVDASEALCTLYPEDFSSKTQAAAFADVNEDGFINAKDATMVLIYSARVGTGKADQPLGTHTYWADSEGNLRKGLFEEDGKTYYAEDNFQLTELNFVLDGKKYILQEDGSVIEETEEPTEPAEEKQTGFCTIDGKLYYFDAEGAPVSGWIRLEDGSYYSDENGLLSTGQTIVDNKIYYFSPDDGKMQTGWVDIDGNQKYYSEQGALQAGWLTLDTGTYFLQTTGNLIGSRVTGLQRIGDSLYLFDQESGVMQTGSYQTDTIQANFNEAGRLVGWMDYADMRFYADADGIVGSGLTQVGEALYYFGANGRMQTGFVETENGTMYFNKDGTRYTGWLKIGDSHQYYAPEDGYRASGFRILTKTDGSTYGVFFDETTGNMCTNGLYTDSVTGKSYYINAEGTAVKGMAIIPSGSDNFYFFDMTDYHMATGWFFMQTADPNTGRIRRGNLHYYDENGLMVKSATVDNWVIDASGNAVSNEKSVILPRLRDMVFAQNGVTVSDASDDETTFNALFNYVRKNAARSAGLTSLTPEQMEEVLFDLENPLRWSYFASKALQGEAYSSEYIAAELDYLLRQAGFTCVVMYGKNSTGYHYWNAVKVNGQMRSYDAVNGWTGLTDDEIIAKGGYDSTTVDYYDSVNDMIYN